jgi:hypothetical protein
VLAVRGDVVAEAAQAPPRPLAAGARLDLGDTIVSRAGKAKIALNDGTVISVGENSRIRLADFASAPTRGKVRMHLIAGVARFTAKIAPGGSFEVETETAIAAVRGTDWVMDVTPGQTAVAVVDGAVAVSSRNGAPATVVLDTPQQGTDVRRGAPPTPPRPWGAQRYADTLARASFD